jgi:hypothetical protein
VLLPVAAQPASAALQHKPGNQRRQFERNVFSKLDMSMELEGCEWSLEEFVD